MKIEEVLYNHFKFRTFKLGQKEIISSILDGQHTMAMLPTGTGKSLCYQLPGYLLKGQVIIVSPLLSLMQDQVEQMKIRGEKRVVAINSFLSWPDKRQILNNLNNYKFIYISPEMLGLDHVLDRLKRLKIGLFVIDEAHCISQWGFDFRPEYRKLGAIREKVGNPLTLALTATATSDVVRDIVSSLHLEDWKEHIFSVDRPNISMKVETLNEVLDKQRRVVELVEYLQGPGIIYFSSKKLAEETAELLKSNGNRKVMAYHGGLEQESRILIQQQFLKGELDVICATSAFGMGINKEDVRFVIHYHMPLQIESYLQEIGRAGRDGEASVAILLYVPGDEQLPLQLIDNELPSEAQIDWLFEWMGEHGHSMLAQSEADIRSLAGFTDTQWRLIFDYIINLDLDQTSLKEGLNNFKIFIQNRNTIKRKKIAEVKNWTQSTECRREKILKYFDEQKKMEITNCCDRCGIQFEQYNKREKLDQEPSFQFHWKDYLSAILKK
ncbi:RecQ family ATP-dependent DNA helicase [Cytobacillus sp. FJAT-54145]|uniref:ATP-dependent DNA helicase RecQ n=1 Tax=Cytobacillus spartinae TaxID=3299023 RepID=A0ABW6KIG9_9BACI